jgi:biopolymer transport protein ExbB
MIQALVRIWELVLAGGPVMVPLVGLSFWLWILILVKAIWLGSNRREKLPTELVKDCLAGVACPTEPATGPRSRALAWFLARRTGEADRDQLLWEAAVRREAPNLYKHLAVIMVLCAAAPLLGLLGTVTGMIETFDVIRVGGTGNPRALASGISEALITTQAGLLVALPGLFAALALRRQARHLYRGLITQHQAVARWLGESVA